MINVLLGVSNPVLTKAVKALLDGCPGVKIVAEAADATEVGAFLPELKLDVLLVDVYIAGRLSGVTGLWDMLSGCNVKTVIFSGDREAQSVVDAFQAGAYGYILINSNKDEWRNALRMTCYGNPYVSPGIAAAFIRRMRPFSQSMPNPDHPEQNTGTRQIIQDMWNGYSRSELESSIFTSHRMIDDFFKGDIPTSWRQDTSFMIKSAVLNGIV